MDRIVEGTYTSTDEAVKAVERLLDEGYLAEELLIITDEKHEDELEALTLVNVESVGDDEEDEEKEESLWDKIKETFRMGDYTKDSESNTLVEHGVDAEKAEHFNEALENHEIIILTDSTAPAHSEQLSTVNEEVLQDDESDLESQNNDHSNPSEIETKESMDPATGIGEPFDPSKSQSAREDVPGTSTASSPDKRIRKGEDEMNEEEFFKQKEETDNSIKQNKNNEKELDMFKQDREEGPHLTGDEKSVNTDDGNHVYPENISKGVVGESNDNTSETAAEARRNEHPYPQKDVPGSDAYYSNKYEDAGGKTIRDDEEE